MASSQEVKDTGIHLKCFRWSTNVESRKGSSHNWLPRLLNRSSGKINVIPLQEEVSNEGKTGQTMPKEEYDRVMEKMSFLYNQLSQKDEEKNTLKNQLSDLSQQKDEEINSLKKQLSDQYLSQQGNFLDSREGQSVPKKEYDRVVNTLTDQLSLRDEEISDKDEQIYLLRNELCAINVNLGRLLSHLGFDISTRRTIIDNLSKPGDKTGEVLLSLVASNYQTNKEKGEIDDKNSVRYRVERDIIGAVPTPLRRGRPPIAPVSDESRSYNNPVIPKFGNWDRDE